MALTIAILTIVSALVPFFVKWYQRRNERQNDPAQQNQARYEAIDQQIATSDEKAANASTLDDLDQLERLERVRDAREGDQRGPDADPR